MEGFDCWIVPTEGSDDDMDDQTRLRRHVCYYFMALAKTRLIRYLQAVLVGARICNAREGKRAREDRRGYQNGKCFFPEQHDNKNAITRGSHSASTKDRIRDKTGSGSALK